MRVILTEVIMVAAALPDISSSVGILPGGPLSLCLRGDGFASVIGLMTDIGID